MGKVLHASYSGYFPFCVQKGKITSGSFIEVTLKEAMSIYWKIQTMSYEWFTPLGTNFSEKQEGKIQRSLFSYEFSPLPDEQNLVCGGVYWSYDAQITDIVSSGTFVYPISNYAFTDEAGVIFNWGNMVQSDGIFYIPIDLFLSLGDNEPATYTLNYAGTNDNEELTTINILDNSVQALYWKRADINPYYPTQMTISPLEYWSYGSTYNTSTGQPL